MFNIFLILWCLGGVVSEPQVQKPKPISKQPNARPHLFVFLVLGVIVVFVGLGLVCWCVEYFGF